MQEGDDRDPFAEAEERERRRSQDLKRRLTAPSLSSQPAPQVWPAPLSLSCLRILILHQERLFFLEAPHEHDISRCTGNLPSKLACHEGQMSTMSADVRAIFELALLFAGASGTHSGLTVLGARAAPSLGRVAGAGGHRLLRRAAGRPRTGGFSRPVWRRRRHFWVGRSRRARAVRAGNHRPGAAAAAAQRTQGKEQKVRGSH